ncbi:hypothetical protein [Pseudalkalibacillus salsuginis]|uniref:hypothetical protein n=1 Tax=Pseudalkalibacillus salsuginis TaxID=2910972 RepID=UPI001F203FB4|nr:hypothetical protein [Pseudalkalibacillus salsuginis]MCF6409601.1 hypothetical protein [Pseudalkalibacillus salsuginis]
MNLLLSNRQIIKEEVDQAICLDQKMTKTIHMLNLPFEEKWIYHPTVLYNENSNSYVLVDTGMPG